jgi:integrase/recombinase XerD
MTYMHQNGYGRRQRRRNRRRSGAQGNFTVLPDAAGAVATWPGLWGVVHPALRKKGYTQDTRKLYRHVLRRFSSWFGKSPTRVTAEAVNAYISYLVDQGKSWSWISSNVCILRTVFDKLCGMNVSRGLTTPRRPKRLPETVSRKEAWRVLSAGRTARDQLLLGLLYGSGLKVGEACRLRWRDIDLDEQIVSITARDSRKSRRVLFAAALAPLLKQGIRTCDLDDFVFRGAVQGSPLSTRRAEMVVRQAAIDSGVDRPVCGMTLRHSYAKHRIEDGATVREVQQALGHVSIHATMTYLRLVLPADARSPLERIDAVPCEPADRNSPTVPVPAPSLPADLPFALENAGSKTRAAIFYQSLQQQVGKYFLALRRARSPG